MLAWLPPLLVTVLMLIAMIDMLAGVFLRYVWTRMSDWFNLPPIEFFWAEEVGEFALTWITLVGAAIGIARHAHFTLHVLTPRLSSPARRRIDVVNALLIVAFGLVLAWYGWGVAMANSQATSPGLSINLFWLYVSAVVGGILIAVYALASLRREPGQ